MTTIKLSKTAHVRNILAKNPTLPIKEVATRAKCDISMVYQIRKELASNKAIPQFDPLGIAPADLTYQVTKGHKDKLQAPVVDMVNNPPHYTVGGIKTIDYIKAKLTVEEYKGFLKGTILAYASRVGHKDGTDDAGKIGWYAKKLGELK